MSLKLRFFARSKTQPDGPSLSKNGRLAAKRFNLLILGLVLFLGLARTTLWSAGAAVFTVNSTADALDANPGDGVCETALDITESVSLNGSGAGVTVVDGNGAATGDRVFHVLAPAGAVSVSITGLSPTQPAHRNDTLYRP